MEARLGSDFSDVRVHTDDKAVRSAAAVSATAYTVGSDVVFGEGYFNLASPAGRHQLAHELVHVRQQRHGRVAGTDSGGGVAVSDPADSFEREAEAIAARVASGLPQEAPGDVRDHNSGRPEVQLAEGRSVQRCGGGPCDCAADEQDSAPGDGTGAPALRPVQRAILARSDAAPHRDQILTQPGTTARLATVQRQAEQSQGQLTDQSGGRADAGSQSAPTGSGGATYSEGTNAWRFQTFLKPDTGPFTLEIFALTDDMIGHAWVGIKRNDGKSQTIGFWPDAWYSGIVGPGRLISPDPHEGQQKDVHTLDEPMTLDQAQKILPVIAAWDHSTYSLLASNCTDFAVVIWEAVTGETPAIGFFAGREHPIVWTPGLLGEDIDVRNKVKAQLAAPGK
jgi:hypothetical protein